MFKLSSCAMFTLQNSPKRVLRKSKPDRLFHGKGFHGKIYRHGLAMPARGNHGADSDANRGAPAPMALPGGAMAWPGMQSNEIDALPDDRRGLFPQAPDCAGWEYSLKNCGFRPAKFGRWFRKSGATEPGYPRQKRTRPSSTWSNPRPGYRPTPPP